MVETSQVQADRHDGLRVRQQREGLRIVHAGMIAESMELLGGQTSTAFASRRTAFALRRVEATVVSASPEGLTTVTDALSAKARKPSPGLEEVHVLTGDPRFAAGCSFARCGIHWASTAHTRRHESRTARRR